MKPTQTRLRVERLVSWLSSENVRFYQVGNFDVSGEELTVLIESYLESRNYIIVDKKI